MSHPISYRRHQSDFSRGLHRPGRSAWAHRSSDPHPLGVTRPVHIIHSHHERHLFRPEVGNSQHLPPVRRIRSRQPQKVSIDACQIFGPDTVFLQQAAHLTGGSYLHLERRDALLQYLIVSILHIFCAPIRPSLLLFPKMSFLPPLAIRKVLAVPTQDKIDFRAACFCHKNIVDIGFVCSVCLSSQLPAPPTIPYIVKITHAPSSLLSTGACVLHVSVSHCHTVRSPPLTENLEQNFL